MQLVVGRIGRAHGVRGDVAVEVRTDDPERRFAPGSVLETEPAGAGPLRVEAGRWHSGRLLVRFTGVADRDRAGSLRGTLLVVDSSTCPALDGRDEYWDHDLTGLAVVATDGSPLGTVTGVIHPPGPDLLVIERDGQGELLVPFVAVIVPEVDLTGGRLVVDPPAGLLDL